MKSIKEYEFWFVTGSQHLYGPETLEQVAKDSQAMVDGLNASGKMPCKIVYKPTVKTPAEIKKVFKEASYDDKCLKRNCLDAHIQSVKDVDKRSKGLQKALLSFPYTV